MHANFSMQPLKCKNIVLKNEIHFDYKKLHGFNGNTLCSVKNDVYILQYSYLSTYPRILILNKIVFRLGKFIKWSDMLVILFPYSRILMKT